VAICSEWKGVKMNNWKEFKLADILPSVNNSKAYHKTNLKPIRVGIPYISRTNLDNGFEDAVVNKDFNSNPKNSIVFGAENAMFFYQPFEYITGNKMYYIKDKKLNRYTGLFITAILNTSIKNCGFGYGKGLTGTRMKNRSVVLPVDTKGNPDWAGMERYMREVESKLLKQYKIYLGTLENARNPERESSKPIWQEFRLIDIFTDIQRGKRLKTADHRRGLTPYISSTAMNNGVDGFVGNKEGVRIFKNCLSLANSGSVGSCFYEPFSFVASDHITKLYNNKINKYSALFISNVISRISEKYGFNREINDQRIKKEVILLPANDDGNPNYEYMESTMRRIEAKQLRNYVNYLETRLAA